MSMTISTEYLAGLFDGEGCIYVFELKYTRKRGTVGKQMMGRAVIVNAHLPTLKAIQSQWRGTLNFVGRPKPTGLQVYSLTWTSHEELLKVLGDIQPFLLIKKDQVDLFLTEFAPTMRRANKYGALTQEQHDKRRDVKGKLSALKQISYPKQENSLVQ